MGGCCIALRENGVYSLYVLLLLLLAYLLNQLDRYTLPIVTLPMSQDLHYGDKACLEQTEHGDFANPACSANGTSEATCNSHDNSSISCTWNYNGQGFEYQLLAGPIFIVIYTFVGIPLGIAADRYNRKLLLAGCLMFWSIMTVLSGLVKEYWQLALLRFGLGIGEAGCTPFAASLIADYFTEDLRGFAFGVYNFGIYIGYSMSFAIGNFVLDANILGQGWRWVFYISGIPGILLSILILFTLKEPERRTKPGESANEEANVTACEKLRNGLKPFVSPSLLMLCLAGSIRNAAGYVWGYNNQPYYMSIGQSPREIGTYMSWIPLVAGSIGVLVGGLISDRIVKKRGPYARVFVLIGSQVLAAPFAAGALFLSPPWAYLTLIPGNILGEMWVSVALAVLVELVPSNVRTTAVAVYLFIITNIGGNMPLLVPVLKRAFRASNLGLDTNADSLRAALYVLYPGLFLLGSFLFLLSLFVLKRDISRIKTQEFQPVKQDDEETS